MTTIFPTAKERLDFAKKFLHERLGSLQKDAQICINKTLPFPALLYCFAIIDLLGSLYVGDATGDTKTYGKQVGTTAKARKYMVEFMKYFEYESELLQDRFRHKIVHLAQPQAVISDIKNNRKIGWMLHNKYAGKHMLLERLPLAQPVITLTPYPMSVDYLFTISIEKMVQDIDESVNCPSDGYLEELKKHNNLQSKFDTAIGHIYAS
jgi:hypothetical protein